MKYSRAAELDHSVPGREWTTIGNQVFKDLNERLAKSGLADVDLELLYCPILKSDRYIEYYPARSRYERTKKLLGCAPQLDHARYMAGDFKTRRNIYLDGLLQDAVMLMRRAKLPDEQITEFEEIIEAMKSDSSMQTPPSKGR